MNKTLSISHLSSGGLITNYYCSSACKHCLYRCSPHWPKTFISPAVARQNFQTALALGCTSMHIGGGEPLLNPDGVVSVLQTAQEVGMAIEYVETNSSWFREHEQACCLLGHLRNAGLSTLLVSISPLHNEYIPFAKVKGVIKACQQSGISVFPWITEFAADLNVFDEHQKHSLEEYQAHFGPDYIRNIPQRYWISMGGRSLDTFGPYAPGKTIPELVQQSQHGCTELNEVNHFHLDLFQNYIPGLCAGFSIHTGDLSCELDPNLYPAITSLHSGGIGKFLDYAANTFNIHSCKETYCSKCELCFEIRKRLVLEKHIQSRELQPVEHYTLKSD